MQKLYKQNTSTSRTTQEGRLKAQLGCNPSRHTLSDGLKIP
ncbi:hypothetical protein ACG2K1_07820 [Neisseria sp. 23W00296]